MQYAYGSLGWARPVRKSKNMGQTVGARDRKPFYIRALKAKPTKAQRRTSPLSSARTPLYTAVNDAASKQEDGYEGMPSQQTNDEQIPSNQNMAKTKFCPRNGNLKSIAKTEFCQ